MKKFFLRRIGVVGEHSNVRPSLQDCVEIVLQQADTLIGDVLEGLASASAKATRKNSFGDQAPISKAVTDLLCAQTLAIKRTFNSQLREAVYNTGSIDFSETVASAF